MIQSQEAVEIIEAEMKSHPKSTMMTSTIRKNPFSILKAVALVTISQRKPTRVSTGLPKEIRAKRVGQGKRSSKLISTSMTRTNLDNIERVCSILRKTTCINSDK